MLLTLFLYIKSYFNNINAMKDETVDTSYYKLYTGTAPYNVEIARQTLKNQFELPIFFYFLTTLIIIFNNVTLLDIVLAWVFVVSRYIHCYIRLNSNHVPHRALAFQLGLYAIIIWWITFLYKIL